eukprot:TRINITY_DN12798_c0_g1_i1.p1 TRINITY_DN12798_c0_g1~~TRINITY_DN12798_c0_g1_i1.p1  ORF type:complete len:565 (+),score=100.38 TRINITY_DN12798_c0_g1_i1:88-1782(+)
MTSKVQLVLKFKNFQIDGVTSLQYPNVYISADVDGKRSRIQLSKLKYEELVSEPFSLPLDVSLELDNGAKTLDIVKQNIPKGPNFDKKNIIMTFNVSSYDRLPRSAVLILEFSLRSHQITMNDQQYPTIAPQTRGSGQINNSIDLKSPNKLRIEEVNLTNEAILSENKKFKLDLKWYEENYTILKEENSKLLSELDQLKQHVQKTQQEYTNSQTENNQIRSELVQLKQELATTKKERDSLRKQIELMEAKQNNEKAKPNIETSYTRKDDQLLQEVNQLKFTFEELSKASKDQNEIRKREMQADSRTRAQIEQRLKDLESRLNIVTQREGEARRATDIARKSELEAEEKITKMINTKFQEMNTKLTEYQENLMRQNETQRSKESTDLRNKIEELSKRLSTSDDKVVLSDQKLQSSIEKLKQEFGRKVEELTNEVQKLRTRIDTENPSPPPNFEVKVPAQPLIQRQDPSPKKEKETSFTSDILNSNEDLIEENKGESPLRSAVQTRDQPVQMTPGNEEHEEEVYASETSTVYHRKNCSALIEGYFFAVTINEARSYELVECQKCKP